jgi:hypothetical protein
MHGQQNIKFVFDLLGNRTAIIVLPARLCNVAAQCAITNNVCIFHSLLATEQHESQTWTAQVTMAGVCPHNPKNKIIPVTYAYWVCIMKHSEQNVASVQQVYFLVLAASPCVKFHSAHTMVQVYINITNSMVTYWILVSAEKLNSRSFLTQRLWP